MWMRYFSTLFPTRKPQDFTEYTAELHANLAQPGRMEALQKMIPLGRAGTVEEAANAVYLFCTPESNYISGQVLVCGGGLLI